MNYFLKYTIGSIKFATPIEEIKEVTRPKEIVKSEELPKNIAGFFNLRGKKVLLYDLPHFLEIKSEDKFEVIIIEIGQNYIGFKVNNILGIISASELSQFPEIVKAKNYLIGVIKQDKELLQIISLTRLLSGSRYNAIKKYLT